MNTVLHISPTPALQPREVCPDVPESLFQEIAPSAVLGECRDAGGLPIPIAPSSSTLFGPRGACLVSPDGPLWVSDTGHHRLMGWKRAPTEDHTPADWLIGQPHFESEGRNAKAGPGPDTLNVPTGIAHYQKGLVVADAWNHRVLMWKTVPHNSHTPADIVLGQHDMYSMEANRGKEAPTAASMHWPYGVWSNGETLFVADTGNRRVLVWHTLPTRHGQPADLVLGQRSFDCRDENAGGDPNAMSMRWPHGITMWNGNLCVADAGNNRIMIWAGIPTHHGADCQWILGQHTSHSVDHNRSLYWPRAETLNMPYGITSCASCLLVADTANSRLLGWSPSHLHTGAKATGLAGQPTFNTKGDNQWSFPRRESLCWPYSVQACGKTIVVADSGNNRIQLWSCNETLSST